MIKSAYYEEGLSMKRFVSVIIALAMVLPIFPAVYAEEPDINKGLIAYYDFETDAERPSVITDKSGHENDAEVLNTVREGNGLWDPGVENILTIENGVASFPGNKAHWGGGDMGAALKLRSDFNQGIQDFTYSAWIKADSTYEENAGMTRLFDFGNISEGNARNSIFVRYTPATGLLRLQDRGIASGSDDEASLVEKTFDNLPFTDAWGLLTVTFEFNLKRGCYMAKVYINGEEQLSADNKFTRSLEDLGNLNNSTNGLFIGRTVWGATNQEAQANPDFCGQMDEIRIYNRAITPEEVQALYETTSPVGKITMASYEEQTVATTAGDYPILPDTVKVTYTSGAVKEESVTWEALTSDMYSSEGTVIVKGVTENGHSVTVKLVVSSKAEGTLSQGLVLYYDFTADEGEPDKITDVSGNGRDGIVDNMSAIGGTWGGTITVESKITVRDGAAYFPGHKLGEDFGLNHWDGKKTYNGAAIKLPNGTNEGIVDFTYSAWIYADTSYRYNGRMQRFFDFGKQDGSSTNSIFFRYTASSGDSRFQDRRVASSTDDASSLVSASLSDMPFNDKWGMLTITYRKTEAGYYEPKVYINGEERYEYEKNITTLTKSLFDLGVLDDSTNGLWIGRTQWNNTDNPDFCGKMDEIRLYNRALSAEEVMELYTKKKPSDMPIDYDELPKTEITVSEDVTVSGKWSEENLKDNPDIMASDSSYDNYRRYVLMRFKLTESEMEKAKQSIRTVIRTYCTELLGNGEYYIYALTGENNAWNIDTITYNTLDDQTGLRIDYNGKPNGGELVKTLELDSSAQGGYIDWDITSFMQTTAETDFSFLITTSSSGVKMKSAETDDAPRMIIYQEGTPINVKRVTEAGDVISETTAYAAAGQRYVYSVSDTLTAYNGEIYVFDEAKSSISVESVSEDSEIVVAYKKASEVKAETAEVVTYVGKAPTLPRVITVTADGESAVFGVSWNEISAESYAQKGEFEASGSVINTSLEAKVTVKVFPERNGAAGCDLTIYAYLDGVLDKEVAVNRAYGEVFTLDESYSEIDELHELQRVEGDASAIGDTLLLNELGQHIELYYVTKEALEADFSARVKAEDMENTVYTIRAEANVLNTEKKDVTVCLGVANYDEEGKLISCNIKKTLVQSRTGETVKIEERIPYTEESKRMRLYLWDENLRPLADAISVGELKVDQYFDEEVIRMTPTYDNAVSAVRKANDYWQANYSYDTWTSGIHPAFWSRAAYHTGNIEAYKLLGDENYLKHSVDWANYNKWMGNDNTDAAKEEWTWGYNQTQGSNAVLFGDWQICFQSYLDMAELGVEDANLDRVFEVMDYQISKDEDGFWWWADSLYMVMPVMTKLYKRTGDEKYLDALYKYFRYAKELMYDGPEGIPTDKDGYTTSASLKNGASYSNPDDYKYLFYRDANYCFPLNAISGHANEKNFWARGDGWVFAGLAKVLTDMPETYEHYDEFKNTYLEMAKAIIACQKVDREGHGFWTQSMLLDYPKGNNGNDEGYETSGTAFFTYGLFWGINNGLLDEETYLEPAIRGYGYLDEVALLSDGKVGYVQPIGSNATQATGEGTTQDFGVGAFLLANCEAARWAQKK